MSRWVEEIKETIQNLKDLVNPSYLDDMSTDYLTEVSEQLYLEMDRMQFARDMIDERIMHLEGMKNEDDYDWVF